MRGTEPASSHDRSGRKIALELEQVCPCLTCATRGARYEESTSSTRLIAEFLADLSDRVCSRLSHSQLRLLQDGTFDA